MAALYVILKITTNDFGHLKESVEEHNQQMMEVQKDVAVALQNVSKSLDINTKIMETILRVK